MKNCDVNLEYKIEFAVKTNLDCVIAVYLYQADLLHVN